MTPETAEERAVSPIDAMRPTYVPDDEAFATRSEPDWKFDRDLQKLAERLINDCPELSHLSEFRVRAAWKRKGGTERGRPRIGGVVRGNAVLRELGDTDFIVWLAADHCRDFMLTDHQRDAALYHQLSHCAVDERGHPFITGHDFEGFESEIERYGAWSIDLQRSAPTLVSKLQPALPGFDDNV